MVLPGAILEGMCLQAKKDVLLVAPFIKIKAFRRLLDSIPSGVSLTCVTRWRLDEIASGISNIEVWPILKDRPSSNLWLRPDLHAKYYRVDDICLIGSANITNAALGWSNQRNLELCMQLSVDFSHLKEFETELMADCVEVDDTLYDQIQKAAESIKQHLPPLVPEENIALPHFDAILSQRTWIPTLRHPEQLYKAHVGSLQELSTASQEAALHDLSALQIPPGLPTEVFKVAVGSMLLQKPIIRKIDTFISSPQCFGAVKDLLATLPCNQDKNFDPGRAWQTIMRWLLFFLPNRYRMSVPHYSEIFYRVNDK